MDTAKPAYRGTRSYDKELILDEVIAVCFHYLGPGRRQGVRFVWRCPECGKDEKFAAHATKNICGCLNAGCEMPQTMNSLAFIGNRENLQLSGGSFVRVLERGYDILNLEHPSEPTQRPKKAQAPSSRAATSSQAQDRNRAEHESPSGPSFFPGSGSSHENGRPRATSQFTRAKAAPPPPDTPSPDVAEEDLSYSGLQEDVEDIEEYEVVIVDDNDSESYDASTDDEPEEAVIILDAEDLEEPVGETIHEITDGSGPTPTAPGRRLRAEPLKAHRSYETGLRGDAEAFAFYEEPDYTIDEELLDAVYSEILEHCPLVDSHRDYLKTRGVSAMTAHRARIGSITRSKARSLKNHLLKKFSEEDLLRVPGFSRRRLGRLSFTLSGEYLLIPYHDADHNITTIEGRVIGKPQKGDHKYVSLRGSGSHLYVFPEFMPDHLEAFCEGVLGAIVAAQSGIAIGSIQGVRRHRDPQTGGSLQELAGVDFGGRRIPYIPDVDVKPAAIADVKAEIPKACRNLIAAQNGVPQVALLPEGKDLDEWILKRKASERRPAFTSFVAGAVSLEGYLQAATGVVEKAPQEKPSRASTPVEATGGRSDQDQDEQQYDPPKHLANPGTPGPLYEPPEETEADTTPPQPPPAASRADHRPSPAPSAAADGTPSLAKVFGALVRMSSLQQRDILLLDRLGIPEQIAREAGIGSMSKIRAEDIAGKLTNSIGAEALSALDGFGASASGRVELDMTGDYCLIPYRDARGNITAIQAIPVSEDSKGPCVDQERKTLVRGLPGDHLYVPAGQPEKLEVITTSAVEALRLATCGIRAASIRKVGAHSPAAGEQTMAELAGVDFGGRKILYAPLLGNPPRRNVINDAPQAMRTLIARQNGTPALLRDQPEGQPIGEFLLSQAAWERREKFELLLSGAETFNQLLPRESQRPNSSNGAGPAGGQGPGDEPRNQALRTNTAGLAETGTITTQDAYTDMPAPPIPVPKPGYRSPSPPRLKDLRFTQEEVMSGLLAALLCILVPLAALTLWHLPAGLLGSLHGVLGDPVRDRVVESVPLALAITGACLQALGHAVSAAWVTAVFYGSALAFIVAPYVVYRRRGRRVDLLMVLGVIPPTKRYLRRFGRN